MEAARYEPESHDAFADLAQLEVSGASASRARESGFPSLAYP